MNFSGFISKIRIVFGQTAMAVLITGCAFNGMFYDTKYGEMYTIERSGVKKVFEFKLKNEKDKLIHTAFVESTMEEPKGSVFYLHGNAGPIGSWIGISEMYTAKGYNFYIMDYQGFGESEGRPTHKNLLSDAQLAYNHFLKLDEVQAGPKIIHGMSIGGHLSVELTKNNQKNVDALVVEEAFSSHKETAKINGPGLGKPFVNLLVKNVYPASESIQQITTPTLIMASKKDKTAPYWMSEKLYKKCGAEQKELWEIPGEHGEGLQQKKRSYILKLNELIKK